MRDSVHNRIEKYIDSLEKGAVITNADFNELTTPRTASKSLERLEKAGKIEKVMRGIFWKRDDTLSSPDEKAVASAIAKANSWQIIPTGKTALHYLGLATKPEKWTFITNGTYRKYEYDGKIISFLHSSGKWYKNMSEKTILLVQAIKEYGKEKLSGDLLKTIADKFKPNEQSEILSQCKNLQKWVSDIIRNMFTHKEVNERG